MARRKKHQKERILEPVVPPGKPIKVPEKVKVIKSRSQRTVEGNVCCP